MRMLILLFLVTSCASVNYDEIRTLFQKTKETDITIFPGHLRLLKLPLNQAFKKPQIRCQKQVISLYRDGELFKGYLAESYFSPKKPYTCLLEVEIDGSLFSKPIYHVKVLPYKYRSGRLNVDKRKLILSPEDLKRVLGEKAELKKVYKSVIKNKILFKGSFEAPLKSKITSYYGTQRVYNNYKKSPHLGIDFRAAIGVTIPVANDGKVVYTKHLFFSGKTVIVDHGLSVFTTYSHLSKIRVTTGDLLQKGDIVGLAGKTGRVSGPHLHWGAKIHGHWVSGFSLVKEGI